jgi:hypothetical protein
MKGHWAGIVSIWIVTAAAAVVALVVLDGDQRLKGLSLVLSGAVVLTFCVQLLVAEKVGFVTRLTSSVLGAFGVVLLASLVGLLVPGT